MPEFTVHFTPGADLVIKVRVDHQDSDEDTDDLVGLAIDLAHDRIPESLICPQDMGWGDEDYTLDVSGTDIEPYAVYDADGTLLYEQKPLVQEQHNEIARLERRIGNAQEFIGNLRRQMKTTPGLWPGTEGPVIKTLDAIEAMLQGRKPEVG